jgi:hypothetical protein
MLNERRTLGIGTDLLVAVLGIGVLTELMLRIQLNGFLASPTLVTLRVGRAPMEAVAASMFGAYVLLAAATTAAEPTATVRGRFYALVVATTLLALSFWAAFARGSLSFPVEYTIAGVCAGVTFIYAALHSPGGPAESAKALPYDAMSGARRLGTWIWLGCTLIVLGWSPEPQTEAIQSGEMFRGWFIAQKPAALPRVVNARVTVTQFVDYQCPFSRLADRRYSALFARLKHAYGDAIAFVERDFPLNPDCNANAGIGRVHPAACEASAALRLIDGGQHQALREWMWEKQETMTARSVLDELARRIGRPVSAEALATALEDVRKSSALDDEVKVKATPAFFINGIPVPLVSSQSMEWAILTEMTRSQRAAESAQSLMFAPTIGPGGSR